MTQAAFQRLTLANKLVAMIMAPVALALILAFVLIWGYQYVHERGEIRSQAVLSAELLSDLLGDALRRERFDQANMHLQRIGHNERVRAAGLYDTSGSLVATYHRDGESVALPGHTHSAGFDGTTLWYLRLQHSVVVIDPREQRPYTATLAMDVDATPPASQLAAFGLACALAILASALAAFLFSRKLQATISTPIADLALLAHMVGEERDFSVRAIVRGDDEVGSLARQFNTMLAQLEDGQDKLREAHMHLEHKVHARTRELEHEAIEHRRTAQSLQGEVVERERAEAHLQEAIRAAEQANRSKTDFLANMSHEIRTPMNGIIGMTELLLSTSLTSMQVKYADTIRRSGRALLKIIGDILDYSKVEAGQLSIEPIPFDLQVACEDVVELLATRAEEKRLTFDIRYAPTAPRRLVGDAGRIRQILTNLAGNAIKFTHEGYVLIDVDCAAQDESRARVRISVEDTGIGAPQEKLDEIFGAYAQADPRIAREYGGTGLGLAISKHLVHLMGGSIGAQQRPEGGSRFFFELELHRDTSERPAQQPRENLEGVRVLVADHSAIHRRILSEQLASWNMRVDAAETADVAVSMLRDALVQSDAYDIAIVDEQLPQIRGEALARIVKSEPGIQDTVLVLQTNIGQRGDAQRMAQVGFAAYLTRPTRQRELLDALATVWGAKLRGEKLGLVTRHTVAELAEPDAVPSAGGERAPIHARVLIAEDNYVNQQVAIEIIQRLGCTITIAEDGTQALRYATSDQYDAILMDCEMPLMDGFEATRQIRAKQNGHPRVPIIAMTACAMKGDRERCLEAGMDDYVTKPIDPDIVHRVLARWASSKVVAGNDAAADTPPPHDSNPPKPVLVEGDLPVLDVRQALWVTGGKAAIVRRIAHVFVEHMPARLGELRDALSTGDTRELHRVSHSIKGASASVGGVAVRETALQIERIAKAGSSAGVDDLVEQLEAQLAELIDALQRVDWSAYQIVHGYAPPPREGTGIAASASNA